MRQRILGNSIAEAQMIHVIKRRKLTFLENYSNTRRRAE